MQELNRRAVRIGGVSHLVQWGRMQCESMFWADSWNECKNEQIPIFGLHKASFRGVDIGQDMV